MTVLLRQAFDEAGKLPEAEQNLLATWLLAELAADDEFDRAILRTSGKLVEIARAALDEHHAGETEELDPESL